MRRRSSSKYSRISEFFWCHHFMSDRFETLSFNAFLMIQGRRTTFQNLCIRVFTRWCERKHFRSSFRWSLKDPLDQLCCLLAVSRATTSPSNRKHFVISWLDMLTITSGNIYKVLIPISIFFTALMCSGSYFCLRKSLLLHCTKS